VGEDPLERAGGARRRVFLTEGAVGRKPAVDQLAPPALDRAVDVGDQRPVELRLDAEAVREGGLDEPPGLVGKLQRRGVVALDVIGGDPGGRCRLHDA
jgi:hypothetical protein